MRIKLVLLNCICGVLVAVCNMALGFTNKLLLTRRNSQGLRHPQRKSTEEVKQCTGNFGKDLKSI